MILEITRRADRQIKTARRWWLQNRDKAPEAFDEELDRAGNLILSTPYIGKPWQTRSGKFIRKLTLDRIRYYLYYRVHADRVVVVFFWHTSRRPPGL